MGHERKTFVAIFIGKEQIDRAEGRAGDRVGEEEGGGEEQRETPERD